IYRLDRGPVLGVGLPAAFVAAGSGLAVVAYLWPVIACELTGEPASGPGGVKGSMRGARWEACALCPRLVPPAPPTGACEEARGARQWWQEAQWHALLRCWRSRW